MNQIRAFFSLSFFVIISSFAGATPPDSVELAPPAFADFTHAAREARPSVVHIKTYAQNAGGNMGGLEEFFREYYGQDVQPPQNQGEQEPRLNASGSGVIISQDGFIITNNHIVENADEIEVILSDRRTYTGSLVGADAATDIALIKVDATDLSPIKYGNSDSVEVGDWVMAVGNPFNLTSTVTAGIVSAKGRNINILSGANEMAIESFIQTDAAVNPGNSGGALVNLRGGLVGINTAIASPTGAFAGYSFAVPVNLVKKVVTDLKLYKRVQRGLLGVLIRSLDSELAKEKGIESLNGVYVQRVNDNSAAEEAGLKEGDIITSVNDFGVNSPSELQEIVALQRPGDTINISYRRNGKSRETKAVLQSKNGTTALIPFNPESVEKRVGATLEKVPASDLKKMKIDGGVQVADLEKGSFKDAGIEEGFVITHIDKERVRSVDEATSVLENVQGRGVLIEGVYSSGEKAFYAVGL